MRKIRIRPTQKGLRACRNEDLSKTKYYYCNDFDSLGRTFTILVRTLLKEKEKSFAYFIVNPENLTITGSAEFIVSKYKARVNAGNRMKGPFWVRHPSFFSKRLLRGMIKYKSKHKDLYKKLVFLSKEEFANLKIKEKNSVMIPSFKIKNAAFCPKLTVKQIVAKL